MLKKAIRWCYLAAVMAMLIPVPGCTARSITITSSPPGAEVTINRRVVGVTPCRVGFTHYGVYRIELRKEKYEPLVKEECINPPLYSYEPVSLVTDNAIPARLNDDIYLHYVMTKEGEVVDRTGLLQRAAMARNGQITRKDGSVVTVPYSLPEKTPEQIAKEAQKRAEAAGQTVPGTTPTTPPVPNPDFKIKSIPTDEPAGPRIGKELNIQPKTPTPDKKPETPRAPEPKKDQAPIRTPKPDELNFEKPAPKPDAPKDETPNKDQPKEQPKTEAPKAESAKDILPK